MGDFSDDEVPNVKRQRVGELNSEDTDDEDLPDYLKQQIPGPTTKKHEEFFLDTIDKEMLDFDTEKLCSVSLANFNVYCCLVCGKFLQGRSRSSYAYEHAVEENHRPFMNLETKKAYILPENVELTSPKATNILSTIREALSPEYTPEKVEELLQLPKTGFDLHHMRYTVGFIGLNNISANDYANVVIQALAHIAPIMKFYLSLSFEQNKELQEKVSRHSTLNAQFSLLLRKLWSDRLFRSHISPREILQLISSLSKKRFSIDVQSSPKDFMIWLLNHLYIQISKVVGPKNVLSQSLQGKVEVTTIPILTKTNEKLNKVDFTIENARSTRNISNFWLLTLSIYPTSLSKSDSERDNNTNQIPELSILDLLAKYDGQNKVQGSATDLKSYKLVNPLPPYLIFHIDRELSSDLIRNRQVVVKFPRVIDMAPYVKNPFNQPLNYRIISNIRHQLVPGNELDRSDDKHQWSISICKNANKNEWLQIKDLEVKECEEELMFLNENYIQIWQRC